MEKGYRVRSSRATRGAVIDTALQVDSHSRVVKHTGRQGAVRMRDLISSDCPRSHNSGCMACGVGAALCTPLRDVPGADRGDDLAKSAAAVTVYDKSKGALGHTLHAPSRFSGNYWLKCLREPARGRRACRTLGNVHLRDFTLGLIRMDRIGNGDIRGTVGTCWMFWGESQRGRAGIWTERERDK